MAMNKYMHPRNIYRTPPDFSKLAKDDPEFANISKLDVKGKINIDFKNPQSLRILTKCLLRRDFELEVEIPEDRLVPTLPLRLNYILWIEDLMNAIGAQNVTGIDIGTGACAIYPLLGAKINKWKMIGTEADKFSATMAQKNVSSNKLNELIKIEQTTSSTLLQHLFTDKEDLNTDFCMCNPPFYSNIQEVLESRSPARPPPKNGFTGSPQELITEGGELEFIRKLIAESKFIHEKLQIYTTMVGHKFNLNVLLEDLKSDNITHTYTEFCQGRITRWGLAWTFKEYNIHDLVPVKGKNPKKQTAPLTCPLPILPNVPYDLKNITNKITSILNDLTINYKVINKRGNSVTFDITAKINTWSNQRKRKRMLKRLQEESKKIKKTDDDINKVEQNAANGDFDFSIFQNNYNSQQKPENKSEDKVLNVKINKVDQNTANGGTDLSLCHNNDTSQQKPENKSKDKVLNVDSSDPIVHALTKIVKRGDNFILETDFLNGTGGKEGVHQIIQYIKNNWKYICFLFSLPNLLIPK